MSLHRGDPDETIVVDPGELEVSSHHHLRPRPRAERHDDESGLVLGKGTRDQPARLMAPISGTQPIERPRDPAEVLRMWPASVSAAPPRPPPRARRVDDKVELAHLALELFRELGQIGAAEHAGHGGSHERSACTNHACAARINELRGGLVEACLLVQRVVMMSPATSGVENDVREILELLDR